MAEYLTISTFRGTPGITRSVFSMEDLKAFLEETRKVGSETHVDEIYEIVRKISL